MSSTGRPSRSMARLTHSRTNRGGRNAATAGRASLVPQLRHGRPLRMTAERRNISSGSPFEPTIGFSRAVRVGDRVLVSGTAPVWPDGNCPDDAEAQAARCLEIVATALEQAGARLDD